MEFGSAQVFVFAMFLVFSVQLYRCVDKYKKFEASIAISPLHKQGENAKIFQTIDNRHVVKSDRARFPMVTITPVPGYRNPKPQSFMDTSGSIDDVCHWRGNDTHDVDYK